MVAMIELTAVPEASGMKSNTEAPAPEGRAHCASALPAPMTGSMLAIATVMTVRRAALRVRAAHPLDTRLTFVSVSTVIVWPPHPMQSQISLD
jgi:hypothetical protein